MSTPATISPDPNTPQPTLAQELSTFHSDCINRYKFNSYWDNALNILGVLLGAGIVAAGVFGASKTAAILGAFVSAVLSAQRAFPFGQRSGFYRKLIGQAENLQTQFQQNLVDVAAAVTSLNAMRLDYADQFPPGASFKNSPAGSGS